MTGHELSPRRALEPMVLADRLPATALPATPPQGTRSLMLWLFFLGVAFFGVLGTWAATASMRSFSVANRITAPSAMARTRAISRVMEFAHPLR